MKKWFLFLVFFAAVVFIPFSLQAKVYKIESHFFRETKNDSQKSVKKKTIWFAKVSKKPNIKNIGIFSGLSSLQEDRAFCSLEISGQKITWKAVGGVQRESGDGFFLSGGFPAPCDWYPIDQEEQTQKYEVIRLAGERKFVQSYVITKQTVSSDEAASNGFIKCPKPGSSYISLVLKDPNGKQIGIQVWPQGKTEFWVYEETPFRRSWAFPLKEKEGMEQRPSGGR